MHVVRLDPVSDPRWKELASRHPRASAFHQVGWLRALKSAYGFSPVAYATTTVNSREVSSALVLCPVHSWLTGKRMVSIPFADHCDPLCEDDDSMALLLSEARKDMDAGGYRYLEIRPRRNWSDVVLQSQDMGPSARFAFHTIDLSQPAEQIYGNLHKTSIRQMIGRAEREALAVNRGRDSWHRDQFYSLLLKTRRKHAVPPQPRSWFATLSACLGEAIVYHIASTNGKPVAAIVTIRHGDQLIHKYGCSDAAESSRGGTQLLLWQAIRDGQQYGVREFDMGRSDLENAGLVRFKERWGARATSLVYHRCPAPPTEGPPEGDGFGARLAKAAFSRSPNVLLELAGRLLYRHVA